jgi:hypothetical protein
MVMLRKFRFAIAITAVASIAAPVTHFAAFAHERRHVIHHWHGYGFLPGYHQPPNNSVPMYRSKNAGRRTPDFAPSYWNGGTPSYWYGGGRYYLGEPHFFNGRWNGGSFGPCWTYTPIGLMWNCG